MIQPVIDHVNIPVSDLRRAGVFYERVLAVLGLEILHSDAGVVGFGAQHWILGLELGAVTPLHLAFVAQSPDQVDAFHAAAMKAGARDNGAPGARPQYGPGYYAAFILDPDGHNLEAVFRGGAA